MQHYPDYLTRVRTIARNSAYNLIASIAPIIAGLIGIRVLVNGLGTERFGILALTWTIINYSSLLDLGIGRALTQLIAEELGLGRDTSSSAWTGTCLLFGLGVAVAGLVAIASPKLVEFASLTSPGGNRETLVTLYVLAVSIPFIFASSGIGGVLSAYQEFKALNAVRAPVGIATFLVPVVALRWTHNIGTITALLVCIRILSALIIFRCAQSRCMGAPTFALGQVMRLLRVGAWMMVSNLVNPLLVYVDRFVIAGLISVSAAAYYVTPYEVATRLWIIPGAIMQGIFPAFATRATKGPSEVSDLYSKGTKAIGALLFVPCLIIVVFAKDFLSIWLGPTFSEASYRVLQYITIGVFINSIGQVAFGLIQAAGRPDVTAKVHLFEAPIYLGTLYIAARYAGINGVAFAWCLRVLLDSGVLCHLASHFGGRRREALRVAVGVPVLAFGALLGPNLDVLLRCVVVVVLLGCMAPWFYYVVLSNLERASVIGLCLSKGRTVGAT